MNRLDEALERLRIANAVPRIEEVDADELEVVTALFDERRSRMTARSNEQPIRTSPGPGLPRRAVLAFATAMTLVLAAVGVVALMPGGKDEVVSLQTTAPTVMSTVTPTTVPPTTTGPVDTTIASLLTTWTRVPHDDAIFGDGSMGVSINDLTLGNNGLVAVGTVLWQDGSSQGAAWISPDGDSWLRVPHDDALFGSRYGDTTLNDVVAFQGGYLAAGCNDESPQLLASADGLSWSAVDLGDDLFAEPSYEDLLAGWARRDAAFDAGTQGLGWFISGLAVSDDRIVAVGSAGFGQGSPVTGVFDGGRFAAVWTSTDGVTWTRVPHNEAVFGGLEDGEQSMTAVAATSRGFTSIGADRSGSDFDAAVWLSEDGISWQRVPHDESIFGGDMADGRRLDQTMVDLVTVGDGLLVVGTEIAGPQVPEDLSEDDADLAVWLWPDGATWQRLPHEVFVFWGLYDQYVFCVAILTEGFMAVGNERSNSATWDPLGYEAIVWVSDDGVHWSKSATGEFPPGSFMKSVLTVGTRVVAVGGINNDDPLGAGVGAMWIRE